MLLHFCSHSSKTAVILNIDNNIYYCYIVIMPRTTLYSLFIFRKFLKFCLIFDYLKIIYLFTFVVMVTNCVLSKVQLFSWINIEFTTSRVRYIQCCLKRKLFLSSCCIVHVMIFWAYLSPISFIYIFFPELVGQHIVRLLKFTRRTLVNPVL